MKYLVQIVTETNMPEKNLKPNASRLCFLLPPSLKVAPLCKPCSKYQGSKLSIKHI